ncbi:hypothetical protein [Nonomuraea dietziae]|uniref:hypothetical protein n=1 Tax=Nonomuraea dietziae TaxID=65515 RepID=UPI0033F5679A
MDTESTTLAYGPSAAEVLQADFPGWIIWRDFTPESGHGDWRAQRVNATSDEAALRHADLDGLRTLLEQADA